MKFPVGIFQILFDQAPMVARWENLKGPTPKMITFLYIEFLWEKSLVIVSTLIWMLSVFCGFIIRGLQLYGISGHVLMFVCGFAAYICCHDSICFRNFMGKFIRWVSIIDMEVKFGWSYQDLFHFMFIASINSNQEIVGGGNPKKSLKIPTEQSGAVNQKDRQMAKRKMTTNDLEN